MVEVEGRRIIIDCGPDFREQMLRANLREIDAILLTHEHKDHTGGLDDVRAFNFVDFPIIRVVDIYATERTAATVRKDFDYAFVEDKYRGVPEIRLHEIDGITPFNIKGIDIMPIAGRHSTRFNVTGYRIGKLAYMTDFKEIDECELRKLEGVEVLIINALRFAPHPSHFSVEEATAISRRIAPRRTILTHLSHEIGLHATSPERLPQGIELGYDGMVIEL